MNSSACPFNSLHDPPASGDYHRFFPDGLAELFPGVNAHWEDAGYSTIYLRKRFL